MLRGLRRWFIISIVFIVVIIVSTLTFLNRSRLEPMIRSVRDPVLFLPGSESHIADSTCSKRQTNVAFAKTHKTGSSTLQNILLRFGVHNDLTFAFPKGSWMFNLNAPLNATEVLDGPWKELGQFNIFAAHCIWNYDTVTKIVPQDAKFITILRDPVDCFESNYVYMGLQEHTYKMDINQFATTYVLKQHEKRRPKAWAGKNNLLWDLGAEDSVGEDPNAVDAYIKKLDAEFDLVLITERFEESVLLMQDLFCWDTADIGFISQNRRTETTKSNMTKATRSILKEWLWADYKVYDHFIDKFEKKVAQFGALKMAEKRRNLETLNAKLFESCLEIKTMTADELAKMDGVQRKIVHTKVRDNAPRWCQSLTMKETTFVKNIRDYQTDKVSLKLKKFGSKRHL